MSATNRGALRQPQDFYQTPAWCVRRLLERVSLPGGHWLDPCAGSGAIIRATNDVRNDINWRAIEIREEEDGALFNLLGRERSTLDYLSEHLGAASRPQVILTNPPYSLAEEFLEKALREARHVAFLLRLNYLGSNRRAGFFHTTPPDVYVLPNRPSFVKGHTDSCEYAWFVWGKYRKRNAGELAVLRTTPKLERVRDASTLGNLSLPLAS